MASVANDPNGRRRVVFYDKDGLHKTIRLGKMPRQKADQICAHIDALNTAATIGQAPTRNTAEWLSTVGNKFYERLMRAGLVGARVGLQTITIAEFIDAYIKQRAELKPNTITIMKQSRKWLVEFFGENRLLDKITTADADNWHAFLIESKLAKATYGKRCKYVRHFYDVAERRGLVESNPFAHISCPVNGDPARRVFVPAEDVVKVMEQAPDPQWKLLIALGRWGGLRVPSEPLNLKWGDIDLAGRRFIVRAPKTEGEESGGIRVVPMFPELVELFQTVYDEAQEGAEYVITRYRHRSVNLRTQLIRYIEMAGLQPWKKLWMNMRLSRATELADIFPSHVCAAWLGHSEKIAKAFYRQVRDTHFETALQMQNTLTAGKKAALNPALSHVVKCRNETYEESENTQKCSETADMSGFPQDAECTRQDSNRKGSGPMNATQTVGGGAKSGAISELAEMWPHLAPKERDAIMKIARAARPTV